MSLGWSGSQHPTVPTYPHISDPEASVETYRWSHAAKPAAASSKNSINFCIIFLQSLPGSRRRRRRRSCWVFAISSIIEKQTTSIDSDFIWCFFSVHIFMLRLGWGERQTDRGANTQHISRRSLRVDASDSSSFLFDWWTLLEVALCDMHLCLDGCFLARRRYRIDRCSWELPLGGKICSYAAAKINVSRRGRCCFFVQRIVPTLFRYACT